MGVQLPAIPTYRRWLLPVIWFLTAPSVIYLCFVLPLFALNRWHFLPSDCAGCLGLMYLALPVLVVVAKAGYVVSALIGVLSLCVLLSDESPGNAKTQVALALAISVAAALFAQVPRW